MTVSELEAIGLTPRTISLIKELGELFVIMKKDKESTSRRLEVKGRSELIRVVRLKSAALSSILSLEVRLNSDLIIIDYE